ncbi:hypothetical protein HPQ64_12665 [Rhizobiales bacterium]|uniref:hypothetical protein n=1 Tax=Hongsoonwoonella zoysiae TaxID=2821844 RepID=UPI001560718B|nr:hypothetical protein [Hongsoonwoonella zoysiae]
MIAKAVGAQETILKPPDPCTGSRRDAVSPKSAWLASPADPDCAFVPFEAPVPPNRAAQKLLKQVPLYPQAVIRDVYREYMLIVIGKWQDQAPMLLRQPPER